MALSQILLDEAQNVMDEYYQDFAPDDSFFRIEDFANWIAKIYGQVADDIAQMIYKNSLSETGMGQITFSQDWWASKEFSVKEESGQYFIDLDISYLGFTYDSQNSGIQLIIPLSGNCSKLIRTTLTEVWQLNHVTASSIAWWFPEDNKIRFKANNPKKVKVFYLPTPEDANFKLPLSKRFQIAATAFDFMLKAKQQIPIIDNTNDSNNNAIPQTEINQNQLKPLGK